MGDNFLILIKEIKIFGKYKEFKVGFKKKERNLYLFM